MHVRTEQRNLGFTLIEALIAMLVLAIGLVAVAKFQGNIIQTGSQAKTRTEALAFAEQKIEELRDFASEVSYNTIAGGEETQAGTNANFNISWVVTDNTAPDYKKVDVTASWADREGSQSVLLTTFIAKAEPAMSGDVMDILTALATTTSSTSTSTTTTTTTTTSTSTTTTTNVGDASTTTTTGGDAISTSTTTSSTTTTTLGPYTLTISGAFVYYGNVNNPSISVSASGNYTASCTNTLGSYVCNLGPIPRADTWSGSVSVTHSHTYCSVNPPNPTGYSSISTNQFQDYNIGQNNSKCP